MRYTDRKVFLYDPNLFTAYDTQMALRIHDEYVRRGAARPNPRFFEVDREATSYDQVFHAPMSRQTFSKRSPIVELAALVQFQKPSWTMLKTGLTPQQRYTFWLG